MKRTAADANSAALYCEMMALIWFANAGCASNINKAAHRPRIDEDMPHSRIGTRGRQKTHNQAAGASHF
ncbi:hypothetical protein STUTZSP0542_10120 [Stutzerimonas marianensis]